MSEREYAMTDCREIPATSSSRSARQSLSPAVFGCNVQLLNFFQNSGSKQRTCVA